MKGPFTQYGRMLIQQGYAIIPIALGTKGPRLPGWQENYASTEETYAEMAGEHPNHGIGVITKKNPAVDIDCLDGQIVAKMIAWCQQHIGRAPVRVGKAPKSLLLYRTDKPFRKVTSARFYDPWNPEVDPQRKGQRLEILGDGQQFVAYHTHPETGKPYEWTEDWENPIDVHVDNLPLITEEQAEAACREFERLCDEAGWERLGGASASTKPVIANDDDDDDGESDALGEVDPPEETEAEIERVRSALAAIGGDKAGELDYDAWRNVLFALKWTRWECAESLARDWSETSDKHVTKTFNVVWRGAQKKDRGREITLASLFKVAKDAGWDASRHPTEEDKQEKFDGLMEKVKGLEAEDKTGPRVQEIITELAEAALSSTDEGHVLKAIKNATGAGVTDMRRDLAKARKKHAAEVSFMATHAGYAANLIEKLEEKSGVKPVGVEGMIYVYSPSKGVWQGTLVPDYAVNVAKAFDGQENCTRRTDYVAIANHAYSMLSQDKEDFFANAPVGLACAGRFYKVSDSGEIEREHIDHTHRQRVLSPCRPRVGETPLFMKFLGETFAGEDMDEQVSLLQEVIGSIILGITARFEKVILLKGAGRSGKSTIMKIIEAMLPADVRSAVSPFKWDSEYYLASLAGKRLNAVGELPDDEPIPSSIFKTVTGRDTLTGRHPTHRPFNFTNEAAHIFLTNHYVYTKDHSEAFYSRWILIEFRNSLVGRESEQIQDLAKQIIEGELAQIMAWAMQGAKRLIDRGYFPKTAAQSRMFSQWRRRTNTLIEFLLDSDVCELGSVKTHHVKRSEFYATYAEWCRETNRRPMGKMRLYDELDGHGVMHLGVVKGAYSTGTDVVRGVKFKDDGWSVDPDQNSQGESDDL